MCVGSGGGGGGNKKKLLRPHLSFTILQSNSQHQKQNKKMFKCQRCGKHFARRDNLTRHKKRRYDCDVNTSTGGGRNQVCKSIRLNRRNNSDDFDGGDLHSPAEGDEDIPYFDGMSFVITNQRLSRL